MVDREAEEKKTEVESEEMSDADFISLLWRLTLLGSFIIDGECVDITIRKRYEALLNLAWNERVRRKKADPSLNKPLSL